MQPIWLFDLDNTLHNAGAHIFPHINRAMTAYLADTLDLSLEEASALRTFYWSRYGATLRGMMQHHGTAPAHFLTATHQFHDLRGMVVFKRRVLASLRRLPGKKYIFSNAPRDYVNEVLRITGLDRCIHGSFAVEDLRYHPKPQIRAYQTVLRRIKTPAHRCIMVEDTVENLRPAKRIGMKTIWISPKCRPRPTWVDHQMRCAGNLGRISSIMLKKSWQLS